jgi:tetratricopeptide (TPR) repeat protein/TolB-like protein
MPVPEREPFLREVGAGDARMEEELRSLLAHGESAETFFAGLAGAVVSPAIGQHIGKFQLVGILGSGGMGTVYRAHDTRLDRVVALKFLRTYLSAHPDSRERFLVEARAAAALEHPNICSIHEIGETTDGRPFIAMACYEGETLKERLRRGPLPALEAMDIAMQLARGLGVAHKRNIVHRDVKPGNIMLTTDGTVRLLDFGVAKVADVSLTGPGGTPGTIAYMSPEQARGDAVGPAADLWSLGVVLYEMLTGTRPFRGGNDRAVIQAILHDPPDLAQGPLRDASPSSRRIVEHLLRKTPDDRPASAGAVLDAITRDAPVTAAGGALRWTRRHARPLAAGTVALLGIVALVALVQPGRRPPTIVPGADAAAQPTIAVLPFTVRGSGLDLWREGMVDLLSIGLDGAAGIRTIDSRTLLARWHQELGDSTAVELARALAVARRTQARYALVGSIVGAGPRIRLAGDVYDAESGRAVGPVQVDGPSDSVLALVDRLGMQTLGLIVAKDSSELPTLDLSAISTSSLTALKAYLDGDAHYRRSEFSAASEAWERAVRADTTFALAYLGLADAYAWYDGFEQFATNLEHAKMLAARLPPRERVKVQMRWARYTQAPDALASIQEVIRKYPDAADAWYELGEVYFHERRAMVGPEATDSAFRHAADLQPSMGPYRVHLLDLAFMWQPDSARVARALEAYARSAPAEARTRAGRLALALAFGDGRARDSARAVVGTLDARTAFQLYYLMEHPRFADVRRALYPVIASRVGEASAADLVLLRLMNLAFMDGRLHELQALLDDPATPASLRFCGPIYSSARGLPFPQRTLEQRRAEMLTDSVLPATTILLSCAADLAARFGDWSRHAELISTARARAVRALAAGDSARGRAWQRAARVAEAHGLLQRGRKAEALRAFESTLSGGPETLWYVGLLALDLGKLDEAEHAFRALWGQQDGVPARLQLARVLEREGRPVEAREAYQFVAYAWRHADPELQPVVNEARQAVARLSRAEN